jgi:hypothetical protein
MLSELVVELRLLLLSRNRVGSLPLPLGHHLYALLREFIGKAPRRPGSSRRFYFPETARIRTKAGAA